MSWNTDQAQAFGFGLSLRVVKANYWSVSKYKFGDKGGDTKKMYGGLGKPRLTQW